MGEWNSEPDPDLAVRIMKRCIELCPSLVKAGGIDELSIIRHSVGLRPGRRDGPRIEQETIGGVKVVHNYGHGAYGFQASYGTAQTAVELLDRYLPEAARL